MFDVRKTEYGIRVELSGFPDVEELEDFYDEMKRCVDQQNGRFNIYADHRGVKAMPSGGDEKFAELMEMCEQGGLDRSVVIVDSAIAAMQQRRLRDEVGMEGQKIVDAENDANWEEEAADWVET